MDNRQNKQTIAAKVARRMLALLGIMLITLGEYLTIAPPDQNLSGIPPYFWLVILGIAALLLSLFVKISPAFEAKLERLKISETAFEIFLALFLCGLTVLSLTLFQQNGWQSYMPVTLTWFASGLIYILAFRDQSFSGFNLKNWFRQNKTEILLVGLIVLVGAALRFYQLGNLPKVLDGDEGLIGLNAQLTTSGSLANPFSLWENIGSLYLQAINWCFQLLGVSAFSLRLLPAISGVLAIPALYLFARYITGPRIAMIAAFLLATSHAHIHFSRIASVSYIHSTWLVPLELYLLISGLEKRSSWRAAAGGVLLAFDFRIYLTAQIVAGLALAFMLISFIFFRDWFKPALRQASAFWGGYIVMMAPQVRYIVTHPNEFMNRLGQDGTFQSGWLQERMAVTGHSAFQILAGRALHAFMSLIYYPALDFYGSSYPLLPIFSAILFLIGIGLILVRVKSPRFLLLNGYFWGLTLAISIFALPPSADSYRMLAVLPAVFVIAAIGLDQLLEIAGFQWASMRKTYTALAIGVMLAIAILNAWIYYSDFAGKCRYSDNLEGRFASYLGSYAKTVDPSSRIYLLSDSIFFAGSHASTNFLSDGRKIINFNDPMSSYQIKYNETIVASPHRFDELLAWADQHPGGQLNTQTDCRKVILISYKIPNKSDVAP